MGSTFLGSVLSQDPSVFYHYEPLHYIGMKKLRNHDEAETQEALGALRALLNCHFHEKELGKKSKVYVKYFL